MKVAVCLSGLTRSICYGWPLIERYLVRPYGSKVFVHTWDIDNGGVRSQSDEKNAQWLPSFFDGTTKEAFISEEMKASSYMIENYSQWAENHLHQPAHAMFYGVYKVNELRRQFEQKNNGPFDIIIKARMDLFFENFIAQEYIEDILQNSNKIYVAMPGNKPDHRFITDIFAIGTPNTLDIYSSVWNHVQNTPINGAPELYLQQILALNNIQYEWALKIRYRIIEQWNAHYIRIFGDFI